LIDRPEIQKLKAFNRTKVAQDGCGIGQILDKNSDLGDNLAGKDSLPGEKS